MDNGSDTGTGKQDSPFRSIQKAIDSIELVNGGYLRVNVSGSGLDPGFALVGIKQVIIISNNPIRTAYIEVYNQSQLHVQCDISVECQSVGHAILASGQCAVFFHGKVNLIGASTESFCVGIYATGCASVILKPSTTGHTISGFTHGVWAEMKGYIEFKSISFNEIGAYKVYVQQGATIVCTGDDYDADNNYVAIEGGRLLFGNQNWTLAGSAVGSTHIIIKSIIYTDVLLEVYPTTAYWEKYRFPIPVRAMIDEYVFLAGSRKDVQCRVQITDNGLECWIYQVTSDSAGNITDQCALSVYARRC